MYAENGRGKCQVGFGICQIIQPWWFGDPYTKATCLWLKGLPKLVPTNEVEPEYIIGKNGKKYSKIHYMTGAGGNEWRSKQRSLTSLGIAEAMGLD